MNEGICNLDYVLFFNKFNAFEVMYFYDIR